MRTRIAFDIEQNYPSKTIIQVGIAIGDMDTGEILYSEDFLIKTPEIINERILELTGITPYSSKGMTLEECYTHLLDLKNDYDFSWNPIVWGLGDIEAFREQLTPKEDFIFGWRYQDTKALYQTYRDINALSIASSLRAALKSVGLGFSGRPHDARHDAINTFRLYYHLAEYFRE